MTLRSVVKRVWERKAYGLAALPLLTDWVDSGHVPAHPREWVTEVIVGGVLAACVRSLYREADRHRAAAEVEPLTGLGNRRAFDLTLDRELRRSGRLGRPLTLAFLDLDGFKQINDLASHAEGDQVLKDVASYLRSVVREGVDSCFRFGGDEFAIVFVGAHAHEALAALAGTERPAKRGDALVRHQVAASVGAVTALPTERADAVVARADRLMYEAKRAGASGAQLRGAKRLLLGAITRTTTELDAIASSGLEAPGPEPQSRLRTPG